MGNQKLDSVLITRLQNLKDTGTLKGKETVICGIKPAQYGFGPRYFLQGKGDTEFLRMNSNSYLGLADNQDVIAAEEAAVRKFGSGPGAVRFISGTFLPHIELEKKLAAFHGREAAMIFSAAYAAVMGVLPPLVSEKTIVISDVLNHNSIINAIRLSRPILKHIYRHLDMDDFEEKLKSSIGQGERVLVVTDGIFSMRGDCAPLDEICSIVNKYQDNFKDGIVTVVDDSHGVGAFGQTGRGTEEYTHAKADILIATLGKALGVNGGYVVASETIIQYLRETAPFYIYSNPITPSEAAAAIRSLEILDSPRGEQMLDRVRLLAHRLESGILELGYKVLSSEHPIVPMVLGETDKTAGLVDYLFAHSILATGLKYPVVPRGDEEIRFQVSASHTDKDIDFVLHVLENYKKISEREK